MNSNYPNRSQLNKKKKSELQDLLADKACENLKGLKSELIDRLLDIYSDEQYLIDQVQQDLKNDGEALDGDDDDEEEYGIFIFYTIIILLSLPSKIKDYTISAQIR